MCHRDILVRKGTKKVIGIRLSAMTLRKMHRLGHSVPPNDIILTWRPYWNKLERIHVPVEATRQNEALEPREHGLVGKDFHEQTQTLGSD
jgi:hypothetical protein